MCWGGVNWLIRIQFRISFPVLTYWLKSNKFSKCDIAYNQRYWMSDFFAYCIFWQKPNLHSDSLVSKGIIKFFCLSTGSFISNGPYRRYTFAYNIDQFTNLITFHSTLSVSYNSSEKFPHSINTERGKIKS